MLESYFLKCLSDFGLSANTLTLSFSVRLSKDDYVSINGQLGIEVVTALFSRRNHLLAIHEDGSIALTPMSLKLMMTVLRDFGACDLAICHHYPSSMTVETLDDFEAIFYFNGEAVLATYDEESIADNISLWQRSWSSFLKWLRIALETLCHQMLCGAQALLKALLTKHHKTQSVVVPLNPRPMLGTSTHTLAIKFIH